jgi:hypothetical protein
MCQDCRCCTALAVPRACCLRLHGGSRHESVHVRAGGLPQTFAGLFNEDVQSGMYDGTMNAAKWEAMTQAVTAAVQEHDSAGADGPAAADDVRRQVRAGSHSVGRFRSSHAVRECTSSVEWPAHGWTRPACVAGTAAVILAQQRAQTAAGCSGRRRRGPQRRRSRACGRLLRDERVTRAAKPRRPPRRRASALRRSRSGRAHAQRLRLSLRRGARCNAAPLALPAPMAVHYGCSPMPGLSTLRGAGSLMRWLKWLKCMLWLLADGAPSGRAAAAAERARGGRKRGRARARRPRVDRGAGRTDAGARAREGRG